MEKMLFIIMVKKGMEKNEMRAKTMKYFIFIHENQTICLIKF